jgi:hypothetical protein
LSIIVSVKGQESRQRFRGYTPSLEKKSSKKFSKPLDKPHRMWYNNSVLKRGTQQQEKENSKKPERE